MTRRRWGWTGSGVGLAALIVWLMVRPMPFFVVTKAFERPIDTSLVPAPLRTLHAEECGVCHRDYFEEWSTTIHSQAWSEPYFQTDWSFEDRPQICRNCHTPLDRQQPDRVLGFRDRAKWRPIVEPNPDFDAELQHQGVTCAVCHLREGAILGPYGDSIAPHPVRKMTDPNEVCVRCHVVNGERWDTFLRIPPCGTVTEIQTARTGGPRGRSGETVVPDLASLGCVACHMPLVRRALAAGGEVRTARRHLWRGGHEPAMVTSALGATFEEIPAAQGSRAFRLTLTNVGAAHYLPTGTPDRHLTVRLRLLDAQGDVLEERSAKLMRTILWRPFIVDLWDTRLPRGKPRSYELTFSDDGRGARVEALVRYHLLEERRRRRIDYANEEPIAYDVFRSVLELAR